MNRLEILKEVYGDCELSESALTHITAVINLVAKECITKIEQYQIPCGNSPAGELAADWTYDALLSIRDDIKDHFKLEG